ncbi:MAG: ATP-dependent helicase [Methanospirillum sp.]|nr:ATP-dependent helicase [Methanospirillum sp.]
MLTPEQERAIAHGEGHLLLIACAGSGKTETISRRVARLVVDGVDPSSIVAFTFTRRAAGEMAGRIRTHLSASCPGDADFAGIYVGTIHSYCHQRLARAVPRYRGYDLLDDDDIRPAFCHRYFDDLGLDRLRVLYDGRKYEPSRYDIIRDFCRNADLVRDERIDPASLEPPFRECYLAYLDRLDEEHFLDFAGMIASYVEALENDPALVSHEQARVRHLVVDEYQDVNRLQEALIRLMAGEHGSICVVGDDDQCIYQWRGSDYENIISFRTRYPDVTTIRIQQNFRSTPGIVTAAAQVIDRNKHRLPKAMEPWPGGRGRTEPGDIAACFFSHQEEEIAAVVEQIQLLLGRPCTDNRGERHPLRYSDMAVLMRSVRSAAQPLLTALRQAGIPYVVRGGRLFDRPEVDVAMHALAFLGEYPYPLRSDRPVTLRILQHAFSGLGWADADPVAFGSAMAALRRETGRATAVSLQMLLHRVLQAMGGDRAPFPEVWLYNLGELSQLVTAFEHVYPRITLPGIYLFLEYVQGHAMNRAGEGGADERSLPDAVTVSTLHRAKGLQFPVVFMPRLNAGTIPAEWTFETPWFVPDHLFDRERYQGGVEDERRLFYVGITRSEKYLFLSGHRAGDPGKPPANPSIFFDEYPRGGTVDRFPVRGAGNDAFPTDLAPTPRAPPLVETSWSALRYYARCPFDYKLRFVYGFDPLPKEEVGIGRAVHSVLAAVHQRALEGEIDISEIPGLVDQHMVLRFARQETIDRVRGILARQTLRYVHRSRAGFDRIAGVELPFAIAVGDAVVSGQMDLLLAGEDGGVEIRDFKLTGDGARETCPDATRQLQVYAVAATALGHEVRTAGIYAFDTGILADVPVDPEALAGTRDALEAMIDGIRRQDFPQNPEERRCAGCDWTCLCDRRSRSWEQQRAGSGR